MTRRFTGWHMAAILIAGFGVVIAVNFTMARMAIASFGGTVVDNSYVASQRYNGWLAQARAQDREGWTLETGASAGRLVVSLARAGSPANGATVTAIAVHPLGRVPEVPLTFTPEAGGRYRALSPLPPGRWKLRVSVTSGADEARFEREIRG